MCKPAFIFNFVALCICFVQFIDAYEDWVPTLEKFESSSSHPDAMKIDVRTVRKSPGEYALNGTVCAPLDYDDTFLGEVNIYRSATGSSDFKATPYKIPKTSFYKFMTMVYVKMLQKSLKACSNLPQYEDACDSPVKAGCYYVSMCTFKTDGMPGHLQPGYYKAVGHLTKNNLDTMASVTLKVETKSFVR